MLSARNWIPSGNRIPEDLRHRTSLVFCWTSGRNPHFVPSPLLICLFRKLWLSQSPPYPPLWRGLPACESVSLFVRSSHPRPSVPGDNAGGGRRSRQLAPRLKREENRILVTVGPDRDPAQNYQQDCLKTRYILVLCRFLLWFRQPR